MSDKDFQNELQYQLSLQIAISSLEKGFISEKEYTEIDTILLEMHRPILSALLSGKPLT